MSAQALSPRTIRRLERDTGLVGRIRRGWAHGGYVYDFVTHYHSHGWFDLKTKEWGWAEEPVTHYTSCREWGEP